jgi:antitoxin component YwqK of YwqJK toxin-antitoxin module/Tfp pilus assembly protein PilF
MKTLLLIVFGLTCFYVSAQSQVPPPINSFEIYKTSLEYYEEEKYKEALAEIEKVDRNDTNYTAILLDKSRILLALEKYDDAIRVCEEGLTYKSNNDVFLQNNLALAYQKNKKFQEAISILDSAVKKYPNNYILYLNKGNVYKDMDKYPEAVAMYKEAIKRNPYISTSHMRLGLIAADEGKLSQAMMCLNMFLILEPNTSRSLSILAKINEMVSSKYERTPHNVNLSPEGGDDFSETDLIISNYAALSKDYKTPAKIELPVIKQNHALLSRLKYDKNDKGFWMQTYVEFFQKLYDQGKFEGFSFYILQSSDVDAHKSLVKKNQADITAFATSAANELEKIHFVRHDVVNGKPGMYKHFYNPESHYIAMVGSTNAADTKLDGYCEGFHSTGNIASAGNFKEGDKTGKWVYYYKNGRISSEETMKDGVADGKFKTYYDNGIIKREGEYAMGKQTGEQKDYNRAGVLTGISYYKNDQNEGKVIINYDFSKEVKNYEGKYINGELNDSLYEYYDSGSLAAVSFLKDGNINGVKKTFHRNGKIASETAYLNGMRDGKMKSYFPDGKTESEGQYKANAEIGTWKTYYSNGSVEAETQYDEKGKKNGVLKQFSKDGKQLFEMQYQRGEVVGYKFFSSDGKVLSEAQRQKSELKFTGFYPEGVKKFEGVYTANGKKGIWKYYSVYGLQESAENYNENGNMNGLHTSYYANGQLEDSVIWKDGKRDGYGLSRWMNGKKQVEGWYRENEREGYWHNYYANGNPETINYYIRGKRQGYQQYFSITGKLEKEELYKDGVIEKTIEYDSTGKVRNTYILTGYGTGELVTLHENGKVRMKGNYVLGHSHGPFVWYSLDGKPLTEGAYYNDERHGKWKWYNPDGKIDTEGNYVHGKREGEWKYYHPDGKLKQTYIAVDGKIQGEALWYYPNGQIEMKKNYEDDNEEGEAFYYDESGELQVFRNFREGRVISYSYYDKSGKLIPAIDVSNGTFKCVTYYKNGNKALEYECVKGLYQGKRTEYSSDGKLYSEISYKDDQRDGKSIEYYPDGKIRSDESYRNGNLNGICKYYYPDGKTEKEISYTEDEHHGTSKYYNKTGKLVRNELWYSDRMIKLELF